MPAGAFDKGEMLGTSVKAPFCGALAHIAHQGKHIGSVFVVCSIFLW